jgi:hypothetical protein
MASDPELAIDNRRRGDGIRLAKWNAMPEIYAQGVPNVKPTVLAENDPKIAAVFPHSRASPSGHEVGSSLRMDGT